MDKYKVSLRNPESEKVTLLQRIIEYESLGEESRPYYKIKKRFFEEVCSIVPGFKNLGIGRISGLILVKKLRGNSTLSSSTRGLLENKTLVLKAFQGVSKVSIEKGLIPRLCPMCKNPPVVDDGKFLVLHHWGPLDKLVCISNGSYRRMCCSCNSYLGNLDPSWLYSLKATWECQYSFLCDRFRSNSRLYPSFDSTEGSWSKLSLEENKIFWRLLLGSCT